MSLKETYDELQLKEAEIQQILTELQSKMKLVEENIAVHELDPNFLESNVQPLYESLWNLQRDYKQTQTEYNTVKLQLHQLTQILGDIMETDRVI